LNLQETSSSENTFIGIKKTPYLQHIRTNCIMYT